jgi:excisionase family DNA binding protein
MATEFLTAEETCEILKISRRTLYRWLDAGEIDGRKLGGQWRFHPDEVARLVPAPKPPRTALQRLRA